MQPLKLNLELSDEFVAALQRADKFQIRDGVPDELAEYAIGLLDEKSEGPATFDAAAWIDKFDAIVLIESPARLSLAELGLIASTHKRVALLYVSGTLPFWQALIAERNLEPRLFGFGVTRPEGKPN